LDTSPQVVYRWRNGFSTKACRAWRTTIVAVDPGSFPPR
jgi:hypothetical protein